MPAPQPSTTTGVEYAARLRRLSARGGWLRRVLDPQRPYRWNLRRLRPGRTLDIGCGIGRNLHHLDGDGVGVDHNASCVETCRADGLTAFTTDEFASSDAARPGAYDTLLLAHVVEHVDAAGAHDLIDAYLPYLRDGGRVIVITPQERGQASDATHVRFVDADQVRDLAASLDLRVASINSFPFPRAVGRWFTHNETVSVLQRS